MQRDGPTEFVFSNLIRTFQQLFDEYPEQRGTLNQRELSKISTKLKSAASFETAERIIQEVVDRRLFREDALKDLRQLVGEARKNKAVRDDVPLVPLPKEPMDVESFQEKYDTGKVDFIGDWTEEHKEEVMGRVATAVSSLESIFGKGFCGKHAKKLEFRFVRGAGVGGFAKASYFGWENPNRWQPRVSFSEEYEGLLAPEMAHYYEDLLGYVITDKLVGVPDYEYGDVGHGPGDIFGRTGVDAEQFIRMSQGRTNDPVIAEFPELVELFQAIVGTADYARWKDKLSSAYELSLPQAIEKYTGKSPYDRENDPLMNAKYKSELPPEVVTYAEQEYRRIMRGVVRKLTYYQSSSEVWARMLEQYVFMKLSRKGIANPWLTQLHYDKDLFMDETTFTEVVQPILDRLFEKLNEQGILKTAIRRVVARWLGTNTL